MNAFSKLTVTLLTSAALALTFSCSSGGGGGGEPPEGGISSSDGNITGNSSSSVTTTNGSSSGINISSSSEDILSSSSSEVSSSSEADTVSSSSSVDAESSSSSEAVVKTALITEITTATTAKNSVEVSTNGENIEPSKYWVTQAAMDALTTAITNAETVNNNESATQAEVDAAKAMLTTAIATFNDAKQLGAETTAAKAALTAKITEANAAKTDVETANTFPDEFWVTSAQMTALETAIATAQAVNVKANATKAEVEAATAALNTAISTFETVKQPGNVTKCGNRTDKYNPDIYECKPSINPNGIYLKSKPVDPDGNEYEAVLIGTQVWMAENLNYNADGSKCGNGSSLSDANTETCNNYGRLYNWATAMDVCPSGWHLPSDAEWDELMTFVGGASTAGTKLKAAEGWNSDGNGTDEFGFATLPGGYAGPDGDFDYVGDGSFWWSATENDADDAYTRIMAYSIESVSRGRNSKAGLRSVRCVRD